MMDREKFEKAWNEYLKDLFHGLFASIGFDDETELPFLFAYPHCATCTFWYPIHRDGIDQLLAPHEIERVEAGLQGKLYKDVSLGDDEYDHYTYYEFYGWCKRYPPPHRDCYSIISFRSLFSLISRKIPQKLADYQFPILIHTNTCGEWKQGNWVKEFIKENKIEK